MRLVRCHHGTRGDSEAVRVGSVLMVTERRSGSIVAVYFVRRHRKGRVGRAWLPGRCVVTAVSSRPRVVVVAWFLVEHIARRAGGIPVRHGEEVAIAARRQESVVEFHMGVGEGVGWHFGWSDASLGGRLLDFSLDQSLALDLW